MQSLIYFLLWAGLFLVMMRFGCGAHVMGHGHGHDHGGTGSPGTGTNLGGKVLEEDKDPVCGMTVKTASAKSSLYNGLAYFFCSTTCRDKFEAAPATYAKASSTSPNTQEHRHGS
jgi:YHS domain-containing protein